MDITKDDDHPFTFEPLPDPAHPLPVRTNPVPAGIPEEQVMEGSATPVQPKAKVDFGRQDWEQLVTPGHVIGERLKRFGKLSVPLGIVCLAGAIWTSQNAVLTLQGGFGGQTPAFISQLFWADEWTYTDLGNGVRAPYAYAWLAEFNPDQRGLTSDQWTALNDAVFSDLQSHGYDATQWTAVAELEVAPTITRPAKVFAEFSGDLPKGVISVPATAGSTMQVVAYVDGAWAWNVINPMACQVPMGPALPRCQSVPFGRFGNEAIFSLKPQPVQPAVAAQE